MPARKIDSNVTGLAFAEETDLKTLPGSPTWYELEPNSYSDFGGEVETVARAPINAGRQRKRGSVVDLDASGGINQDLTQKNLVRLLQGFFFAAAREKPTTRPLNAVAVTITSATSPGNTYTAASGLAIFQAGHLILAENFGVAANNGLAPLTAAAAGAVTTSKSLVAEAAPPADASIRAVGFQFASGDAVLTVASGVLTLATTTANLNDKGLTPGEWVFLGDASSAAFQFALNAPFYARVRTIAAKAITFDECTITPVADAGATKTIRMFFGTVIRNENTSSLIVRRSYSLERRLGRDDVGEQSEYLDGSIPNELTLNIPEADKLNMDLSFVSMTTVPRTGTEGLRAGTRVAAPGEEAFNTSSDVYRMKMYVVDPATMNPTPLFGYVSEATISINNGIRPTKAIGVVGAFDASAGDFEVGGSLTAFFSTVAAVAAVRANSDIGYNLIVAQRNAGVAIDIPLLTLGGGRLNVTKDEPITIPLETSAAENSLGYTAMMVFFQYLPSVAMPAA